VMMRKRNRYPSGSDVTLETTMLRVGDSSEVAREIFMLETISSAICQSFVNGVALSLANFLIICFVCLNCCSFHSFHLLINAPTTTTAILVLTTTTTFFLILQHRYFQIKIPQINKTLLLNSSLLISPTKPK